MSEKDGDRFWKNFLSPLQAEIRELPTVTGASGLAHPVLALAVDEDRKRAIIASPEADARSAALTFNDISANHPDYRILMARPVFFDSQLIVANVLSRIQRSEFTIAELNRWSEQAKDKNNTALQREVIDFFKTAMWPSMDVCFENPVLAVAHLTALFRFVAHFDFGKRYSVETKEPDDNETIFVEEILRMLENQSDARLGICPIPAYEMSKEDISLFKSKADFYEIKERLSDWGILQYFFPPKDQLTLGLIDRGVAKSQNIIQHAAQASAFGHPTAVPEIISKNGSFLETIDELTERKFVAEIENETYSITESGQEIRQKVKIRPREGLFDKILNRIKVELKIGI